MRMQVVFKVGVHQGPGKFQALGFPYPATFVLLISEFTTAMMQFLLAHHPFGVLENVLFGQVILLNGVTKSIRIRIGKQHKKRPGISARPLTLLNLSGATNFSIGTRLRLDRC